jgi:hypothetical protein
VPLAPLLASDAPEHLAVLEPTETALNLRPGEPVTVRFNRPMVDGARVGKPAEGEVLAFTPPVRGRTTWTSRSTVSFEAAAATWSTTHTASLGIARALRSLAGEESPEFEARTVVFDAGPRFMHADGSRRLLPGEPLRLFFSGKVDERALPSQLMLYEVDGGRRMIPFSVARRAKDAKGRTPVDVALKSALEPGAKLAMAVAPPLSHGGSHPRVVDLELAPRPRIEGIDCARDATEASQCAFTGPPGQVVDIEETLVLLSSEPLGELPRDAVEVKPPLDGLAFKEERLRLVVRGDWVPGQVYEVRVGKLVDRAGHALQRTPPLAVRSAGRAPQVHAATGRLAFEHDALAELAFTAIHVEDGAARLGVVPPGSEIEAALSPNRWIDAERAGLWKSQSLHQLAPTSRPNRWGRGTLSFLDADASRSSMAVIALLPQPPKREGEAVPATFVQRTDLGVDAKLFPRGARVWVTKIASAQPVAGARVTVAPAKEGDRAEGVTDGRGVAWIPFTQDLLEHGAAVLAVHGGDRAVVVVDPRSAVGPRHLGSAPGAAPLPADAWLATVFTDRGICRPGETIHAKALLRAAATGALTAPIAGELRLLFFGPSGEAPLGEHVASISTFGTADASYAVDPAADPGDYRVEARVAGQERPAGSASFTVGEYRPPTFRVDLSTPAADLADKDPLRVTVAASHLFGPPAAGMSASWTLTREPGGAYPARWAPYTFTPADASGRGGTMASGELTLDAAGRAVVETAIALGAPQREDALFEVTVRDLSGLTTSARRRVHTYPATFEVGIRRAPSFLAHGATLDLDAVVIAHDGAPRADRKIEARIVREGWHTYWEWSGHARHRGDDDASEPEGTFQARRAHKSEVVHRCALASAETPVHCTWTAERAGTYLLEATTKDEKGRISTASQRVYVAGPDEHPDRDPPGTVIALTPDKRSFDAGETAEIAFESPFPEAEALLEVARDGVLFTEQRHVSAGGNVIRVPVTAAMVPNAFVSLALVRPRTGPPAGKLDLAAPDLRVGLAEIAVRPTASPLTVKLDAPSPSAPAGGDVPVEVLVQDEAGKGVATEVALYAVDEGTLRVTGYTVPDPLSGLLPRLPPAFAWEDIRRTLVSRVAQPLLPGAGGDGPSGEKVRRKEEEERFDPTPLWVPHLQTDASGRATVTLHLPARPTQYRIMAVAVDEGIRSGRAERTIVAAMPLVVRPVLPAFVTAGDHFEAAAFVHNTEDAAAEVTVTAIVGSERRAPTTVHLEPRAQARVSAWIDATRPGDLAVRFEARSDRGSASAETRMKVEPRGRAARSEVVGAVAGSREIEVALPSSIDDGAGALTLSIAAHPFVGLDTSIEALLASPDAGTEPTASSVIALAAYAALDSGKRPGGVGAAELRARGAAAIARLLRLQTSSGGFGMFTSRDQPDPYLSAYALHALVAARRATLGVPDGTFGPFDRARAFVGEKARGNDFLDRGEGGHDDLAFALRALAEAGAPEEDRTRALFEQRERLSPYGLSQLALALDASDRRRDTLVLDAERRVLGTREDERREARVLRWYDGSARTLGAVLEAAVATEVGAADAPRIASKILEARGGREASWWSTHETSHALAALAAYAATAGGDEPLAPRVAIDGAPLQPVEKTASLVWFTVPAGRLAPGRHALRIEVPGTAYFALAGRFPVPLGPDDEVARGEEAALHRVLEDTAGKPLGPDAHVKLGDLVRVRLFVYSEHETPPYLALRDRLAGGLEPIDAAHETTPQASLHALLGMGPDDGVVDVRGHYASRSLDAISHRIFLPSEAVFYLAEAGEGLREFTYGVRATTVGTFVVPPAELSALYAPRFTARSAAATLTVDP